MKMDVYTIVILRRPPNAPEVSEEEGDRLQAEHVAFNARMRGEGHALVSGPFREQPDETMRGLNVFRTSIAQTRSLMQEDASVRAGRLAVDVFTWIVPEGSLGDRPVAQIEID